MVKTKQKPEREKSILGFEADDALRERLDQVAHEQDRPRSWVIRQLLLRALESQEKTA